MRVWLPRLTGSPFNQGHAPSRCLSHAGNRWQHNRGPCACTHWATSSDSKTALNASTSSRWTGNPGHATPPEDDELSYPFWPLAATAAAPRDGRKAVQQQETASRGKGPCIIPPWLFHWAKSDSRTLEDTRFKPEVRWRGTTSHLSRKPAHLVALSNWARQIGSLKAAMLQILHQTSRQGLANSDPAQLGVNFKGAEQPCRYFGSVGLL